MAGRHPKTFKGWDVEKSADGDFFLKKQFPQENSKIVISASVAIGKKWRVEAAKKGVLIWWDSKDAERIDCRKLSVADLITYVDVLRERPSVRDIGEHIEAMFFRDYENFKLKEKISELLGREFSYDDLDD